MREHKVIATELAKKLMEDLNKDQILILTWDDENKTTDIAIYGRTAKDKLLITSVQDDIERIYRLKQGTTHEDWKLIEQAKLKEDNDRLKKEIEHLTKRLHGVMRT